MIFPITPDIKGETEKEIYRFINDKDLPEFRVIGFNREIMLGDDGYDTSQIYISK